MKKRVLAIAMSLAMTLSLLPVSALAVEDTGEEHPVIQQETDTAAENTAEEEAKHRKDAPKKQHQNNDRQ